MVVAVDVLHPLVLTVASETGRKETVNAIERVEIGIGMPVGVMAGRRVPDERNASVSETVGETLSSRSPPLLVVPTPRILHEHSTLQGH